MKHSHRGLQPGINNMRTVALLLLVAWIALSSAEPGYSRRAKREEILQRSKRRWVLSTIEIAEEDQGPFPKEISQMHNDKQGTVLSHKFVISGSGVTEEPLGVFSIDENTGKVYAHKPVDREKKSLFHIKFDILDKDTMMKIDKELSFDVEIKDINDNEPKFLRPKIVERIPENHEEGSLPVQLNAVDPDQPNSPNSTMTISMLSQNPKEPKFEIAKIDNRTAQLKFSGCFDYDKIKRYDIIAKVADHGTPSLSSTASITLLIMDSNTHLPTFKKTQYYGEVFEMATKNDFLRVAVDDKDTPKTNGWKAEYFFISGNEYGNYEIKTDENTNEGILSIIKGKDFERTTLTTLQIGVKNVEPLFFCKQKGKPPSPNTANITIKVIDVNDPPHFDKDITNVYEKEEEPPGRVVFSPTVTDVDSDISKIKFVLLKDPAGWMTIDPKTGKVSTTKRMDRESPFVNDKNIYTVVVAAVDDGEPPATGTATVLIHLKDINDHKPTLLNNSVTLCVDSDDVVPVRVQDLDAHPYSGPFAFSIDEEKINKDGWKLNPAFGNEGGLSTAKTLALGNYSIPLAIEDQQNMVNKETISVIVCECGGTGICQTQPLAIGVGGAVIGLILGALFLFLLLLLAFVCLCGKQFQKIPNSLLDEGNQTLIMYNQEGGSSECKAEPSMFKTTTITNNETFVDGQRQVNVQPVSTTVTREEIDINSMYKRTCEEEMGTLGRHAGGTLRSNGNYNMYTWSNRTGTQSSRYSHYTLQANQYIADHIHRKLQLMYGAQAEEVMYHPHEYAYEGEASLCQSLDQLSLGNSDDLQFLNNLGPKFKTLEGVCQQAFKEKNIDF